MEKEASNTVRNARPSLLFATLLYMDENRRNRRYLGIAMGTMLRQKGFLC